MSADTDYHSGYQQGYGRGFDDARANPLQPEKPPVPIDDLIRHMAEYFDTIHDVVETRSWDGYGRARDKLRQWIEESGLPVDFGDRGADG